MTCGGTPVPDAVVAPTLGLLDVGVNGVTSEATTDAVPEVPCVVLTLGPFANAALIGLSLELRNNKELQKRFELERRILAALNKYNKCSLDFYYHYLAKIRETVIVDEFADNSLMGSAIHHALDKNYPVGNLYLANFHEKNLSIFHLVINSLHKYYSDKLSENKWW